MNDLETGYLLRLLRESEAREVVKNRSRNMANQIEIILERFQAEAAGIAANADLSDEGKRNRLKSLRQVHDVDLRALEATNTFPAEIDAIREKLAPETVTDPVDRLAQLIQDQEIRAHFRGLDPLKMKSEFETAVNGPAGRKVLGAFERAPFSLLPGDALEKARGMVERVENPALVAELDELLESNGQAMAAIRAARTEVGYQEDPLEQHI